MPGRSNSPLSALRFPPRAIIIMGVSGCGKSAVGRKLAESLGGVFEDADAFHPPGNVEKMSAGIPLTDKDRLPWFRILRQRIVDHRKKTRCYVLACSALKAEYRGWLRDGDPPERIPFVHLCGDKALIRSRLEARKGHFMPASLLDSQLATLEATDDLITVGIEASPDEIAREIRSKLGV